MIEIPLKGNIRTISLPTILVYLSRKRKTGTLVITTSAFIKKVYLLKGDCIFASSTYEDDRLGEMLIKAGKITVEQYDESVKLLKETGKRQGVILIELGYLTPKDLFWGVKFQVKEIIHSLFLLEDAEYDFIEEEIPAHEVITLKMSIGNLIYEGVKRIDNWTRIRNEMPNTDTVIRLSIDPVSLFQNIELSPQDRKMLSLIDGTKTIKELIDSAWIGSFEGMKTLYVFWSIGVLEEKTRVTKTTEEKRDTVSLEDILQPVAEDEKAFMRKVDKMYLNLNGMSPYQLLEVDENKDEEMTRKNYYKLTREFHPDRYFNSADPTLKDKLTVIFDALTHAYTVLKDDIKAKEQGKTLPTLRNAAEEFKRGIEAFKKGNIQGAVDSFTLATESDPGNAKYWSYLSLSFTRIPNKGSEAEKALYAAIKLEPDNADHYANLGLIYTREGKKKLAYDSFQKALKIDPGNTKATKGVEKTKA